MPKPIKKRVQKRQITEKDVTTAFEICIEYYRQNSRFVHLIVIGVLVIMVVAASFFYYNKSRTEAAARLQYEGYKLYHRLYQPVEMNEEEALRGALEKFQGAYDKKAAPVSLLYIANTQYRLGMAADALKSLNEFTEKYSGHSELLPIAYYRIAAIQLRHGSKGDALNTLETLYNLKSSPFFKDIALFEAAGIMEETGRKEEAMKRYKLLKENYPESPYAKAALTKLRDGDTTVGKPEDKTEGEGATNSGKADK